MSVHTTSFSCTYIIWNRWESLARRIYDETIDILWSSLIAAGNEFFDGDSILSVDAFDGVKEVVEADGDAFGFENRTPSKDIPLTSNLTTNCGSPVVEFSALNITKLVSGIQKISEALTFTDNFELHSVENCHSQIFHSVLLLVLRWRRLVMTSVFNTWWLWSVLDSNFPWSHVRIVVTYVMMIVVQRALAT